MQVCSSTPLPAELPRPPEQQLQQEHAYAGETPQRDGDAAAMLAAVQSAAESGALDHHELKEILADIAKMTQIDRQLTNA